VRSAHRLAAPLSLCAALAFAAAASAASTAALRNSIPPPAPHGAPGHPSAAKQAEALMTAGDMAMGAHEYGSAATFYQRAASMTPKDLAPLRRLGVALAAAGAAPDAETVWKRVLAVTPGDWQAQVELGKLGVRLGRPAQAIGYLEAAKATRDDPAIENALGLAHDFKGEHAAAQIAYRAGLALAPSGASLRNNLALSLALSGDYPAAVEVLSALAAEPTASARYRLNLAMVYGLSGDDAKAAAAARRDLGEADNAANQSYYRMLRGLNDRARTQAVFAGQVAAAAPAAPPSQVKAGSAGTPEKAAIKPGE
jgi:Flp pilus assembly protein TadD